MKKYIAIIATLLVLLTISLAFHSTEASAAYYKGKKVSPKAGDILITSKAETRYHSGHSAIVTDNLKVVHIPAPGTHPIIETLDTWMKKYPIKSVVRLTDTAKAKKAGAWARTYQVEYKKATYGIWTNLNTYNKTYCSKLVWQAYRYGSGWDLTQRYDYRHGRWLGTASFDKILPYQFINGITRYSERVY
ncbi:YiiX/YebB-like N1pC/P60 family cysteine hydrolase [Peribacillus sp. SCS-155]|uniref:YiiX/YebB-like N1pC/P60 family cysteine hydrolase n=1 Tax=Peribacillus sedimenti TaxID=3115297 RepID=UPI00390681F7